MEMPSVFLYSSVVGLATLGALYFLRPRPLPSIPSTPSLPFVGHSLALITHVVRHGNLTPFLEQFPTLFGDRALSQILLSWNEPLLLVADPDQIKTIFSSKDFDTAQMVVDIFKGVIPKAMLANKSGQLVSYHRRAFAASFSPNFLSLTATIFASHCKRLLAQWETKSRTAATHYRFEDQFFESLPGLEFLASDVMSEFMYGDSYHQLSTGEAHIMTHDFHVIMNTLTDGPFNVQISWLKRLAPSYRAARKRITAYVAERVEKARVDRVRGGGKVERVESMIDIIMRKEARDGEGQVMPEDELRDELMSFMAAGADTSSTTQLWVLKFLSEHPEVQQRLHDDLVNALPSPEERPPTFDELHPEQIPYLEAVVQESVRLAQSIPFAERQAVRDTTLTSSDGATYFVPSGTQVFVLTGWATRHQHPDAGNFRPDRWLDEKTGNFDASKVWAAPFGGGNRVCYGQRIALTFLRLFIAQLSLSYFVLPLPEQLRSRSAKEQITTKPDQNWLSLRRWEDVEPSAGFVKQG